MQRFIAPLAIIIGFLLLLNSGLLAFLRQEPSRAYFVSYNRFDRATNRWQTFRTDPVGRSPRATNDGIAGFIYDYAPDGSWALLFDYDEAKPELFYHDINTNTSRPLTDTPDWEVDAIISPEGERVAFVQGITPRILDYEAVIILDVATGETMPTTVPPEFMYSLRWSPDGTGLLYANEVQMARYDIATQQINVIDTAPVNNVISFDVSSDGRQLVIIAEESVQPLRINLYVQDLDGGFARPITASNDNKYRPRWSPDSEWIYYQGDDGATLYRIRPDGTDRQAILNFGPTEQFSTLSPPISTEFNGVMLIVVSWCIIGVSLILRFLRQGV